MDSDSGTKAIAAKNVRGNTLANPATSRSVFGPNMTRAEMSPHVPVKIPMNRNFSV